MDLINQRKEKKMGIKHAKYHQGVDIALKAFTNHILLLSPK
jgi:hypothetical protein